MFGGGRPLILRSTLRFPFPANSSGGRSWRSSQNKCRQSRNAGRSRAASSTAGQNTIKNQSQSLWNNTIATWGLIPPAAAAVLGSLAYYFSQKQKKLDGETTDEFGSSLTAVPAWADDIGSHPGALKVLTTEALLAQDHPFLEDDHMFSAFVARGIVRDIEGWYLPEAQKFSAVVALGREVAGFPRVVHGGLTAAIFDEAFGGLLFSLKKSKALKFWGPAYTVHLEVAYKARIKAGTTILCTTEVESIDGRKLWMKATMSDGPEGKVFATARALFVAPKPLRMITDIGKYVLERLGENFPGGGNGSEGRQIQQGDVA